MFGYTAGMDERLLDQEDPVLKAADDLEAAVRLLDEEVGPRTYEAPLGTWGAISEESKKKSIRQAVESVQSEFSVA